MLYLCVKRIWELLPWPISSEIMSIYDIFLCVFQLIVALEATVIRPTQAI